jgi:hypothetical protein
VEEVHAILRQIVGMVLNSQDCALLQRYIVLKREIATVAAASLEKVLPCDCFRSLPLAAALISRLSSPAENEQLRWHCGRCSQLMVTVHWLSVDSLLRFTGRWWAAGETSNFTSHAVSPHMRGFYLTGLCDERANWQGRCHVSQFKEDARQMVSQMVEMERSYLTAEVFREILSSSHATDELSEDAGVRVSAPDKMIQ